MSSSVSTSVTVVSAKVAVWCVEADVIDCVSLSSIMVPCREVGRELGRDAGRDNDLAEDDPVVRDEGIAAIMLLRLDTTESARVRPGGEVTLHRLTLSDLFIMALCTKPPRPLVGDVARIADDGPVRPDGAT